MKVAIITDTHYGVRNDNKLFIENTKRFLDDVFFPYLDEHHIRTVIHAGDLVDRRKYINFYTSHRMRTDFILPLMKRKIRLVVALGNHDVFYKNTNEVNSVTELLSAHAPLIQIHDTAKMVSIEGEHVLLVPWICDANREATLKEIENTSARICIGHLEIAGFEMYRGTPCSDGMDRRVFDKFELVCSGHFHHRSSSGNIHYLGSHSQFTWADHDDSRGFHVLDLDSKELEFIPNPYEVFTKLVYDDSEERPRLHSDFTGRIIKVIVKRKTNPYLFEKFIDELEALGAESVQVVDDSISIKNSEDSSESITAEAESTIDIFRHHVADLSFGEVPRELVESALVALYHEALELE